MQRPRLIYLVTEDWYFITHRLPMARAARDAGYEVHVATRVDRFGGKITGEGFQLHPLNLYRGSVNPFKLAAAILSIRRLHRELSPSVVHHIALQPSVIGSLAAIGLPHAYLNAVFGFGSVFTSNGIKARMVRWLLRPLLPLLFNVKRSMTMVVNPDHQRMLISLGVAPERIAVVPGSGVDLKRFTVMPEPDGPITVGYAGRMLEDKGVRALVEAQAMLEKSGQHIQVLLAGTPDPANPNSISPAELESWNQRPGIRWLGHVEDVRDVWRKAHIAVLASRGEGLPMSLAEAAACGRPLVATDVSGCREIALPDLNAILVAPDNPAELAAAIGRLAGDAALRSRYGAASRRMVEQEFSSERVAERIITIYGQLAGPARPA